MDLLEFAYTREQLRKDELSNVLIVHYPYDNNYLSELILATQYPSLLESAVKAFIQDKTRYPSGIILDIYNVSGLLQRRVIYHDKAEKIYLGMDNHSGREIFFSSDTPTESHFPQYVSVTGPFKTLKAAQYMRDFPNNPHLLSVQDAEKLSKKKS